MAELRARTLALNTLKLRANEWEVDPSTDEELLRLRISAVDRVWASFVTNHEVLVNQAASDAEADTHGRLYMEAEDIWMRITAALKTVANRDSNSVSSAQTASVRKLKLKAVAIPKFNGDPSQWLEFRETFEVLVHRQTEMDPIEKLALLREHVCATKVPIVSGMYTGGYEEVWTELCLRFDNRRWLAETQFESLLNLPSVKDTQDGLLSLVDKTSLIIRSLRQMGLDVDADIANVFTVNMVRMKLPESAQTAWGLEQKTKEIPKLCDLLEYLTRRAANRPASTTPETSTARNNPPPRVRTHVATGTNQPPNPGCVFCSLPHPIWRCHKFKQLSLEQRLQLMTSENRCINCFADHHVTDCTSERRCLRCDEKHNSLLCCAEPATPLASQPTTH